jgi:hypothetical protein
VSLLLPNQDDPLAALDTLGLTAGDNADMAAADRQGETSVGNFGGDAAGLFLANPFLHVERTARRLRTQRVQWVANLPSVTQHDNDFVDRLADVDLGFGKELTVLEAFTRHALKSLVVVVRPGEAQQAVEAGCTALFVMPPVEAFEAGFPSARYRADQLAAVRAAIPDFEGPLLCLLSQAEQTRPATWPTGASAAVIRPAILS